MKKLLFLFSIFTLLTAFTCENEPLDSDILENIDNGSGNSSLVGEWQLVSIEYSGSSTTVVSGVSTRADFTGNSLNEGYSITFGNDGTFSGQGSYDIELITEVPPSPPFTIVNTLSSNSSGTYTATATTITTVGTLVDFSIQGAPQPSQDVESTINYTLSDNGNTLTLSSNEEQTTTQNGVTAEVSVSATIILIRGNGGGNNGGNPDSGCEVADIVDQVAQGNFKGVDFTTQGGTYRSQFGEFFCRIYVSALTGGDCAFPQFGGNEGVIIFSLSNLEAQTITLSDVAGEGESLNFNSTEQGVTEVELASCGKIEILSNDANTVSGRLIAQGQDGSSINGNFTLNLCE